MSSHRERGPAARRAPARGGRLTAPLVAGLVMLVAACGGERPAEPAPDGSPTAPSTQAPTDAPLLQVAEVGGFEPVGADFARVPQLTVYPDGRAVTHGPQIAIYPPPALPNLLVQELPADDVDALVEQAREAGLLDGAPDYGDPPVADARTTLVTLRVDGETVVHEADALGLADELPGDGDLAGLDEQQREARQRLSDFITTAREIVGTTGEGTRYEMDAFAVLAQPAVGDGGDQVEVAPAPSPEVTELPEPAGTTEPAPDPTVAPSVQQWPLPDVSLADAEDCLVVDGQEATVLREALAEANSLTRFEQEGTVYELWARPLLPHEETCADVR